MICAIRVIGVPLWHKEYPWGTKTTTRYLKVSEGCQEYAKVNNSPHHTDPAASSAARGRG